MKFYINDDTHSSGYMTEIDLEHGVVWRYEIHSTVIYQMTKLGTFKVEDGKIVVDPNPLFNICSDSQGTTKIETVDALNKANEIYFGRKYDISDMFIYSLMEKNPTTKHSFDFKDWLGSFSCITFAETINNTIMEVVINSSSDELLLESLADGSFICNRAPIKVNDKGCYAFLKGEGEDNDDSNRVYFYKKEGLEDPFVKIEDLRSASIIYVAIPMRGPTPTVVKFDRI